MKIKEFKNYKILPQELIIQLTTTCNLRCEYCFQCVRKHKNMSPEIARKCIDLMMSKDDGSIKVINLYGGEPTLNLDTMEVVIDRYIENKNKGNTTILYFYINTNGTIMNERFINIIKKAITVTNFRYILSLNGNKESHDKSRRTFDNKPTFDIITKNIEYLKKEIPNIYIEAHAVVDREFIRNLKQNIIYMITNKNFDEPTTEPMFYGSSEEYTREDFEKLVDVYRELQNEGYDSQRLFTMFEGFMEEHDYNNINYGCPRICIPGQQVICIDTEGTFIPCDYYLNLEDYSRYSMGNIINDSENYNRRVKECIDNKFNLLTKANSCRSEYGTYCKEECFYATECQVCNSVAEIMTNKKLIIPKGNCDRTKLMCSVFKEKKFTKY